MKKKRRQRIETPDVKYQAAEITNPVVSYNQADNVMATDENTKQIKV